MKKIWIIGLLFASIILISGCEDKRSTTSTPPTSGTCPKVNSIDVEGASSYNGIDFLVEGKPHDFTIHFSDKGRDITSLTMVVTHPDGTKETPRIYTKGLSSGSKKITVTPRGVGKLNIFVTAKGPKGCSSNMEKLLPVLKIHSIAGTCPKVKDITVLGVDSSDRSKTVLTEGQSYDILVSFDDADGDIVSLIREVNHPDGTDSIPYIYTLNLSSGSKKITITPRGSGVLQFKAVVKDSRGCDFVMWRPLTVVKKATLKHLIDDEEYGPYIPFTPSSQTIVFSEQFDGEFPGDNWVDEGNHDREPVKYYDQNTGDYFFEPPPTAEISNDKGNPSLKLFGLGNTIISKRSWPTDKGAEFRMRVSWPSAEDEGCPLNRYASYGPGLESIRRGSMPIHEITLEPVENLATGTLSGVSTAYAGVRFQRLPCSEDQLLPITELKYWTWTNFIKSTSYSGETFDDNFRDIFFEIFPDGTTNVGFYINGEKAVQQTGNPQGAHINSRPLKDPREMRIKINTYYLNGWTNPDKPAYIYIDDVKVALLSTPTPTPPGSGVVFSEQFNEFSGVEWVQGGTGTAKISNDKGNPSLKLFGQNEIVSARSWATDKGAEFRMRVSWPSAEEEGCPKEFTIHKIILEPVNLAGGEYAGVEFQRWPCIDPSVPYTKLYYTMFGKRFGLAEEFENLDNNFRDIFFEVLPDGTVKVGYYLDGKKIIKNTRAPSNPDAWHQKAPRNMRIKISTYKQGQTNPNKPVYVYIDDFQVIQ